MEPREQARRLYAEGKSLKDIAAELGVSAATVRTWKRRGAWGETAETQREFRKAETQRETNRKRESSVNRAIAESVDSNEDLTEVEKEFCLYYVQCYNISQASWRTGHYKNLNSAKVNGWHMLQRPAVQAEIKRLKAMKRTAILADADDLIEMHMRIAFSDIKDYVVWQYDPKQRANRMAVMPSDSVDGQAVSEISESAQGFKLKMQDKKHSLDFLERFFLANPIDKHKIDYDNARLELERQKQNELLDASNNPVIIVDDIGGDGDG